MREVVEPTMRMGEENFRSRVEQGKVRATDVPLAMRAVAGLRHAQRRHPGRAETVRGLFQRQA